METPRRINQQDVARAANVNRSTVSLALRDHPSIPAKTREHIKAIAEKLGYRPDPMLSALAVYRNGRRPQEFRGTLGWLARSTEKFLWRRITHFNAYYEAARERAKLHGYRLDLIDVGDQGMSWMRAGDVARARGIHGVLLCPQPFPDTNVESFPWDEFAGVTFGYSVSRPHLHSVAPAQFRAAVVAMRAMIARGYTRIGFVMERGHNQRTDCNYFGGYLAARDMEPQQVKLPPLFADGWGASGRTALLQWYEEHRPDAVLVGGEDYAETLRKHGIRIPDDLGVACPILASAKSELTGVWESNERIGETAVDILVSMLHRSERGVPAQTQRVLVEGVWIEGRTLRPLVAA